MKRVLLGVSTAALLSGSVLAQSPPPRPSFDVAGIQVSTRTNTGMRGGVLRGNRYEIRNATMVDLIRTAYDVQPERISGGPAWLEWYRFDIAARDAQNAARGPIQARRPRGQRGHQWIRAQGRRYSQAA